MADDPDPFPFYELSSPEGLQQLIQGLRADGYRVIGPRLVDAVIDLGPVMGVGDLPWGLRDRQEKATYRLVKDDSGGYFKHHVGAASWKQLFFLPQEVLWTMEAYGHDSDGPNSEGSNSEGPNSESDNSQSGNSQDHGEALPKVPKPSPLALLGVRACDWAAIRVQDRVLMEGAHQDPGYAARRKDAFIIGVHCYDAGATCFCASMGTGPEFGRPGWDLLLTEWEQGMTLQVGSTRGENLVRRLKLRRAPEDTPRRLKERLQRVRDSMGREMPQAHIKDEIFEALSSPIWNDIGSRCLACANCTMVCPTCFCTNIIDQMDVSGRRARRTQVVDSCFHRDFSYVHGGSRRVSTGSRYRQWFSHKFASWFDQFGTSGCVGCGRCITWCPVGIDVTEEMALIRRLRQDPKEGGGGAHDGRE